MKSALLGFGSNLGAPDRTFALALDRLREDRAIRIVRVSSLYLSAPWGVENQPEFLNAVVLISTDHTPAELLRRTQRIERDLGRKRDGERWGPRVIDLDVLSYDRIASREPGLTLPHPGVGERSFVLEPLAEIAPDWRHPGTDRSPHEMLTDLKRSGRATSCRRIEGSVLGDPLGETPCRR